MFSLRGSKLILVDRLLQLDCCVFAKDEATKLFVQALGFIVIGHGLLSLSGVCFREEKDAVSLLKSKVLVRRYWLRRVVLLKWSARFLYHHCRIMTMTISLSLVCLVLPKMWSNYLSQTSIVLRSLFLQIQEFTSRNLLPFLYWSRLRDYKLFRFFHAPLLKRPSVLQVGNPAIYVHLENHCIVFESVLYILWLQIIMGVSYLVLASSNICHISNMKFFRCMPFGVALVLQATLPMAHFGLKVILIVSSLSPECYCITLFIYSLIRQLRKSIGTIVHICLHEIIFVLKPCIHSIASIAFYSYAFLPWVYTI